METANFKKIVHDALLTNGLLKKGSYYFMNGEDIFCMVALQKSSYSRGYYINLGIFIKKITPFTDGLKYFDGDITARFDIVLEGKSTDFYDLEKLSDKDEPVVKESIIENIHCLIKPAIESGIPKLLEQQPILLYQTTAKAKGFLGIPV